MEAHFKKLDGSMASEKCDTIKEGEEGLLLMQGSGARGDIIGYIPYAQLEYVEPTS